MAMFPILDTVQPEVTPEMLLSIRERADCPRCSIKQQWYCYFCHCLTNGPSFKPAEPPMPVTFLCYRGEKNSKSSVHGVVASSSNVSVEYISESGAMSPLVENSVLLITGHGAKKVSEVQWDTVRRIYIVDCTWNQVNKCLRKLVSTATAAKVGLAINAGGNDVFKCLHQAGVQMVELSSYRTVFWRQHKQKNINCLSSAEALYYILRELEQIGLPTKNLDNLLTFFLAQTILVCRESPWVNECYKEAADIFKRRWGISMPQTSRDADQKA